MSTDNWLERSKACIGQGYLTNSKNPATDFPFVPSHWHYASGAKMYAANGDGYIDMICGLGAIHWGHYPYPGGFFRLLSGCSIVEVEAAEKFKDAFPWVEKVKFVNDGSEACVAAVRMARTITGRNHVLSEGYHGWLDEFTGLNDNCVGIPTNIPFMGKFSLEGYRQIPEQTAAVILEPVQLDDSPRRIELLKELVAFCNERGIVTIFDEVITGLRYPSMSVCNHHGIHPDLICCGKAFGNGEKVGIVAGRADILDEPYFVSGTYFGHIPSLMSVIDSINKERNLKSVVLRDMANDICNAIKGGPIELHGWGTRANIAGTDKDVAIYRQEMFKRGWYTKTTVVFNWANINYGEKFIRHSKEVISGIASGHYVLEYPMPVKAVAQKVREK